MCGITGFWSKQKEQSGLALLMAKRIQSRGPDDEGEWHSSDETLAMAHRRLSIIDLTSAGHQPMVSNCRQHVVSFNGEIYNHEDIRKELEFEIGPIKWNGHSDTEVLLNSLKHWGIKITLTKLNGMFAFAYWCAKDKALFLARDRIGEKPLYFGQQNRTFLFGSELKALKIHPSFSSAIDREALALYMCHSYIPAPYSIYQNIYKLKPAHYIVVKNYGQEISEQHCYWDLKNIANDGLANQVLNENQMVEDLDGLLKDSIKLRMITDVPFGAFLSGGYDSSTVVALMQTQSIKPVKTFSIGFKDDNFNEAQYAKRVAAHLGTEHTELYPGDGGDELFCGYKRYFLQKNVWNVVNKIPILLRPMVAFAIENFPGGLAELLIQTLPKKYRVANVKDRLPKLAEWVNHKNFENFYLQSISHLKTADRTVFNSHLYQTKFENLADTISGLRNQEKMMLLDILTYLPGDILHKLDRASMAVSLEARVPLLDHRLVEYALRIPLEMKIKNAQGKWPLRQVLYKYVPKEMMERSKQGFNIPIEHWLRGPLKEWASDLLDETRLLHEGFFDSVAITKMWNEHLSGKRRFQGYLWNVLMFQAWLKENYSAH